MAAGSATQNADSSVQVFQDPIPPIPAIPPTLINSEFLSESGQNTKRGYKRRVPLSELSDTNNVHPEKRKVGRPKKAKFTDENLQPTGKNHLPIKNQERPPTYPQIQSNPKGNIRRRRVIP